MSNLFFDKLSINVKKYSEHSAIVSSDGELTWEELFQTSLRISVSVLQNFHDEKFIPLLITDPYQFVVALYSVWQTGKIVVPINTAIAKSELATLLQLLNANKIILGSGKSAPPIPESVNVITWENLSKSTNRKKKILLNQNNKTALVLFTSGSTGYPKGVKITFQNLEANANAIINLLKIKKENNWLASLPFFHIGGFSIIWRAFSTGATLFLPDSFSSNDILQSVKKYKPHLFSVVSTTLKRLISEVPKYKEIKAIFAGGGPIKAPLMRSAIENGFPTYKVYGSTETTSMVTILTPEQVSIAPDSAGKPFDSIELTIQNSNEKGIGEICVKGEQVSVGYLGFPVRDGEFFCTGDLGFIDSNGFLNITGRKSSFIISGGENINLEKVKNALLEISGVIDAEAFGMADENWGERLVSVIVVNENFNISEISEHLNSLLSKYEFPKQIKFVEKIPRTPLGKAKINELKELFGKVE